MFRLNKDKITDVMTMFALFLYVVGCFSTVVNIRYSENGEYYYEDGLTWAEIAQPHNEASNWLKPVFSNGQFIRRYSLEDIRNNLHGGNF